MRSLFIAWVVLVPVAPAAAASCERSVVAGGHLLTAGAPPADRDVETTGPVRAFIPDCGDPEGPGTEIEALRVHGVPAGVAVVWKGSLYVARGSLRVVAGHPLPLRARRRTECRPAERRLRGEVSRTKSNGLDLLVNRRPLGVLLDSRTRITNRPAYQPLEEGQPVAVTYAVCGGTRVAREIAFIGADVPGERYAAGLNEEGSSAPPLTAVFVLGALLLTGAALRWTLRRA